MSRNPVQISLSLRRTTNRSSCSCPQQATSNGTPHLIFPVVCVRIYIYIYISTLRFFSYASMLNVMSYYPLETSRVLLKSAQKISIEFPDLHYNRATVLKYLEE